MATSLEQDPHIKVVTWCKPLGATDMKISLSLWGQSLLGEIPRAGLLIVAWIHSSDLAASIKAGLLYPTGREEI